MNSDDTAHISPGPYECVVSSQDESWIASLIEQRLFKKYTKLLVDRV